MASRGNGVGPRHVDGLQVATAPAADLEPLARPAPVDRDRAEVLALIRRSRCSRATRCASAAAQYAQRCRRSPKKNSASAGQLPHAGHVPRLHPATASRTPPSPPSSRARWIAFAIGAVTRSAAIHSTCRLRPPSDASARAALLVARQRGRADRRRDRGSRPPAHGRSSAPPRRRRPTRARRGTPASPRRRVPSAPRAHRRRAAPACRMPGGGRRAGPSSTAESGRSQRALFDQADLAREQPAVQPQRRSGHLGLDLLPAGFGLRSRDIGTTSGRGAHPGDTVRQSTAGVRGGRPRLRCGRLSH